MIGRSNKKPNIHNYHWYEESKERRRNRRYDESAGIDIKRLEKMIRESLGLNGVDLTQEESIPGNTMWGVRKRRDEEQDHWNLLSYLQNEAKRQRKMVDLFLRKIPNRLNYSETDLLLKDAKGELLQLQNSLLRKLNKKDAYLHQNLAFLLKKGLAGMEKGRSPEE